MTPCLPIPPASLFLRSLTMVLIRDGCSCTGPASKSSPATTTTGAITTGLPRTPQRSATENNTLYNRAGLTNLSALGTLPLYNVQTATSTPSMVIDITTMAKVIPNVPLKLQQKIVQGEFIDLSELLQANFQFKYTSIEANDAFELVHKDETVLMQPHHHHGPCPGGHHSRYNSSQDLSPQMLQMWQV